MVGKWHLGHLPQFLPMHQGFDSWFGLPFSHDMRMTVPRDNGTQTAAYYDPKPEYWDVPLMRNGEVIERPVDHRTLTKRYTEEAVRFIDAQQRPAVLPLPRALAAAHPARAVGRVRRPQRRRHLRRRHRGDRLEHRAHPRRAAQSAGIDRNTLVVFTSDNGPWLPFGDARRLRRSAERGQGHDVGRRRADAGDLLVARHGAASVVTDIGVGDGSVRDRRRARRRRAARRSRDRRRRSERAADAARGPSPRNSLFYYWDSELRAVRKGNYKAHFITSGAYGEGEPRAEHNPPLLFNLAEDPGERYDIAAAHPDVVADLVKEAEAHRETVAPAKPLFDELIQPPAKP